MPDYASQIIEVIGSAPADLVHYYHEAVFPVYPDSSINCLSFEEARDYSEKIQRIEVVSSLGLWVLDDANDSNPFAYISKGPCTGMIIHISHDSESEIAFSSLKQFLAAMHKAGVRRVDIDKIEKESIKVPLDQAIRDLAAEGTEVATFLLTTYLPVNEALQKETMMSLVSHNDFFVREALAVFLSKTASDGDLIFAEQLAADRHPQVADKGKAAVEAIKRQRHNG